MNPQDFLPDHVPAVIVLSVITGVLLLALLLIIYFRKVPHVSNGNL